MATVALGDQQIQIQDFNAYKFLEATELLSQILGVVPEVDAAFTEYAKHWLAENGRESVLDRAAAIFTYGDRAKEIPDEVWEANDNKLRLPQAPPRNEALIRALPAAYRKARPGDESRSRQQRRADRRRNQRSARHVARAELVHAFVAAYPGSFTRRDVLHRVPYRELVALMVARSDASRDRMDAEMTEQGMEVQSDGMPLASVAPGYRPDDAWQRALAEKRRLLASRPRSN
jgi:hypothetical protein